MEHERARVDAGERDDAAAREPVRPLGPARLAHHDAAHVRRPRLAALVGDAVVADHRRREAEDLLGVARVGDDLLVAGHRRREDGLAERDARRRRPTAAKTSPSSSTRQRRSSPRTRPARRRRSCRTLPLRVWPRSHEFAERERKPSSVTRQAASVSSRTRLAGAPTAMRGALEAECAGRPGRHPLEQRLEREQARPDEVRVERGERRLEPGDSEGRLLERARPSRGARAARDRWRSQQIVPSRRPATSAARSSAERSGGFIFTFGSSERTASSVRQRWCGVTSPVAATPAVCARAAPRPTRAPTGASGAPAGPRSRRATGRARPSRSRRRRGSR